MVRLNKSKSAFLFFGLAIFGTVAWILIEVFITWQSRATTEFSCQLTSKPVSMKNRRLLQPDGAALWTFDAQIDALVRENIQSEAGIPGWKPGLSFPLRCQEPGLQCFLPVAKGGFEKLDLFFLKDQVGFVHASRLAGDKKSLERTFPIFVNEGKLHLAAPLKLCGQELKADPSRYFVSSGHLFYEDRENSRLALWNPFFFNGTVTLAAAREPDRVFRLGAPSGIEPSSCEEKPVSSAVALAEASGRLFVLYNNGPSTALKSYRIDSGLAEEPLGFDQEGQDRIWNLDGHDLLLGRALESKVRRVSYSPETGLPQTQDIQFQTSRPVAGFFAAGPRHLMAIEARYYVSDLNLTYLQEGQAPQIFPPVDPVWKRSQLEPAVFLTMTESEMIWGQQQDDDVVFRSLSCSKP